VLFGGQGRRPPEDGAPPDCFALVWNGDVIYFEGYFTSEFVDQKKAVTLWQLAK
jgi:hypothetical protein